MRRNRACVKWIAASILLLISMPACQFSPQTTPSESSINSPAPTAPTQNSTICPPENITLPDPEKLESHIGWQYVHVKDAFNYPDIMSGSMLSIDMDNDYGIELYRLNDNSHVLTLEKFLCRDSTGNPAWEIADVIRIDQISGDDLISLTFTCTRNGENTDDEFIIPVYNGANQELVFAWSIDRANKTFAETSIDGLSC